MFQTKLTHTNSSVPSLHICKDRNRLKVYNDNKVYLNDGEEFTLEIYNPKSTRILVEILLNGKPINNKLIVDPYKRVYLDRFLDEARKFVFKTFEVDNVKETKAAREKNGLVEVRFYDEYVPYTYLDYKYDWYQNSPTTKDPYPRWEYTTNNCFYSATLSNVNDSIETGRVNKGSNSNQNLSEGYGNFNSWYSWFTTYQILPYSLKPQEVQQLREYCTECGTRIRKDSWKYCPTCGEKL